MPVNCTNLSPVISIFVFQVSPANIVPVDATLMKTPLLANHCVLTGFENLEGSVDAQTVEAVKKAIVANDLAEIKVLEKTPGQATKSF